jgi:hypothetical protein
MKCDKCNQPGTLWTLWTGDTAGQLHLCPHHAKGLQALLDTAHPVAVPKKERAVLKLTKLKTTPDTARYKKA